MLSASRCNAASPKVPLMDTDHSLPLGNNVLPSAQVPIAQGKLPSSSKAYPQLKPFLLNVDALITGHATSTKVDNLSQSSLADHSPPGTVRPVSSPLRPLLLRPSILFTGHKLSSTSAQFCQPVDLQSTSVPCQNGSSLTRDDNPAGPFEDQTQDSLFKGGRIQWHISVASE